MTIKAKLTETRIDIGDRHTTLHHFGAPKATPPLSLAGRDQYEELYLKVAAAIRADYGNLTNGRNAQVLHKLMPASRGTKYWLRYLETDPAPWLVWDEALPLEATILPRVTIRLPAGFPAKVSPVPTVLLYPFGWSTCLDIRITGEHTVAQLADLLFHLFDAEAFDVAGAPLRLAGLFKLISGGIREDAFGGAATKTVDAQQTAVVVTVMAKNGGSPALGALSKEDETLLKRIVRPAGVQSNHPLANMVYRFDPSGLEYMVIDDFGRFTWMEHLLIPEDRNHAHLGCYHHNSFIALMQAWQLMGLADAGGAIKAKSAPLEELLGTAVDRLSNPRFLNASLHGFLDLDLVKKAVAKAAPQKPDA
jgi:hypothetical protein